VVVFVSLSLAHLFVVSCVSVCWEGLPLASPFSVYSLYLFPSYNGMTCSSLALFEKKEYLIMFHSQYCKSCYFLLCFKCRCCLFAKFHLNFILPCQIPVFPLHDSCIIFIHYRFGQSFRCSPSSSTYIWLSAWHNWCCNFYSCIPVSSYQWYYAVINLDH